MLVNLGAPLTLAATEPEDACASGKPDFEALMQKWTDAPTKTTETYKEIFEEAQEIHHNYIGCMFKFAEDQFLEAAEDWNSPEQACLTPEALKAIIQKTEPSQMLAPMLDAHSAYKDFLNEIGKNVSNSGEVKSASGQTLGGAEALIKLNAELGTVSRQRQLEITSSLVAIDLSFTALKELRLSLVMHVHFMCIMQSLEKYRKSLGELRVIINRLPSLLRDASVTK